MLIWWRSSSVTTTRGERLGPQGVRMQRTVAGEQQHAGHQEVQQRFAEQAPEQCLPPQERGTSMLRYLDLVVRVAELVAAGRHVSVVQLVDAHIERCPPDIGAER